MNQYIVFILTFLAYAQIHAFRNIWAYLSNYLINDHFSSQQIAYSNLTFLFSYGICMNLIGPLFCKYSLKLAIGFGCITTSFVSIGLAILSYLDLFQYQYILILMVLNGITQSCPYPGCINVLGNWFRNKKIGTIMGIWAGCSNFGDVFGLIVGDIVIQRLGGSPYQGFLFIAGCLFLIGLINSLFLSEKPPNNQQILIIESEYQDMIQSEQQENIQSHQSVKQNIIQREQENIQQINIFIAWKIPGFAIYTLIFGCLKGTFYGFLYWLPYYFQNKQLEKHSSFISQMFDIGTFLGGILIGYLGDKTKKRVIYFCPSLIIAMLFMLTVRFILQANALPYYFCLLCVGLFLGGPYNNISGVIGIELSSHLDSKSISTLSSIIESFGTIVAALFQTSIPLFGEDQLFLFFCCITMVAELCCIPLLLHECKRKHKTQCQ